MPIDVRTHELPRRHAMVGGLAADPTRGCVWVGMAGTSDFLWRFEPDGAGFVQEEVGDLLAGYSYAHRSLVPTPDGAVFAGVTWIMGVAPGKGRPQPFPPGGFGKLWKLLGWVGNMLSSCRILMREPATGKWKLLRDGRSMSADLHWDPSRGRLLRLSSKGVTSPDGGMETRVAPSLGGFVHELAAGPRGELVLSDAAGEVYMVRRDGSRARLGSLQDSGGPERATPGIDGLVSVGQHHMVGGTRNCARPFIIDLRGPTLDLLSPLPTAPRASALASTADGRVVVAAGVGSVGLYRIDPEKKQVESLGTISEAGVPCHHLHDLAALPDGRLFGGEFFPLDVSEPPWPDRQCRLWEIRLL